CKLGLFWALEIQVMKIVRIMKLIIILLSMQLVLPFGGFFRAEKDRRDGNWWRSQDLSARYSYMVGFFDGMNLGHNFSYWKIMEERPQSSCLAEIAQSYG